MPKLPEPMWLILSKNHKIIHVEFEEDEQCMNFEVFQADQREVDLGWELHDSEGYWSLDLWDQVAWEISGQLYDSGDIYWTTGSEEAVRGFGPYHTEQLEAVFRTIFSFGMRYLDFFDPDFRRVPDEVLEVPCDPISQRD